MLLVTAKSCPSLTSTGTISLILLYRDFVVTVNDYILICINGLPKSVRPNVCPNCGGSKIHRHGKFTDAYFNAGPKWPKNVPFTLFRFLCYSHCNQGKDFTFTFFPCFKEPYQSIAIPLQEKFMHCIEAGMTLNQAVLQIFPNQDYSLKTFQRIKKKILSKAILSEVRLSSEMIKLMPQVSSEDLPHKSAFSFLSLLWQRIVQSLPKFEPVPVVALINST